MNREPHISSISMSPVHQQTQEDNNCESYQFIGNRPAQKTTVEERDTNNRRRKPADSLNFRAYNSGSIRKKNRYPVKDQSYSECGSGNAYLSPDDFIAMPSFG